MIRTDLWRQVNQELVAKSIGELHFEEVLKAQEYGSHWSLTLKSGVIYTFEAWQTTWTHLRVSPETLLRNGESVESASQFFLDIQTETGMSDITLANFFEEMHNTLYSDLALKEKGTSSSELASMNGDEVQSYLNGHPKILLNKGRMGWGATDLKLYSPETSGAFQLDWIGIHKSMVTSDDFDYLACSFSETARQNFLEQNREKMKFPEMFHIIPVHPWQWDRIISVQFAGLVARGLIIYLGSGGDFYRPQISIRTLSNVDRPSMPDVKLPLSILNTSCVRGITAKTIEQGKKVSEILSDLCTNDSFLKEAGTSVLKEHAGLALIHPEFKEIKNAPYRYHEYLGVIIRESSASKLLKDEKAVLTASLFFQDEEKKSLVGQYIEKSGLCPEEWLKCYFKSVVIPLYHLQVEYGIGMVAHGQNIIVKLKKFVPAGMFLKDFQGDLRISTEQPQRGRELSQGLCLTELPPHYLIHDLITGHFVTVLRFISGVMKESDNVSEEKFYKILSDELASYIKGKNIPDVQNLLAAEFQKVLLNKVRFKIGYGDTSERPLPLTGTMIKNPMFPGNFYGKTL